MSRYEIARSGAIATTSMVFRGAPARRLRFDERPEWLGVDDYHFRLRLTEIGPIIRLGDVLTGMRTDRSSASRQRQALQYARALDVLAEWMKQGHRSAAVRGAFLAKCLFTALIPAGDGDARETSVLDSALDGRVFGGLDRWIASGVRRGWRSRRVVPLLRGLLWSKPVQRLRGIRIADDAGGK